MNGLRKCKGSAHMYVNGKWERQDFELGYFHQWGVNYEELRDGVGSYMVAIVELPDGRVIMPVADEIIFLLEESSDRREDKDDKNDSRELENTCPYDSDDEAVETCPSYLMGLCAGISHCPI